MLIAERLSSAFMLATLCCLLNSATASAQGVGETGKRPQEFGATLKRFQRNTAASTDKSQSAEPLNESDSVVSTNTLLTLLDVTVTDASGSRFITGLKKEDFLVLEEGKVQEIDTLTMGEGDRKMPRSIVLIIDWSGSLLPYLDESVTYAKNLVDQLAPSDEMAIVTDDVKLAAGFTRDKKLLKSSLDSLRESAKRGWRGKSLQFSALFATLTDLIDVEKKRPVIIFQTDGDEAQHLQDPPGAPSTAPGIYYLSDIHAQVQKSRVKIYALIPGEKFLGSSRNELLEKGRRLIKGYGTAYEEYSKPYKRDIVKRDVPDEVVLLIADSRVRGQEAVTRVAELAGGWTSFFETPEQVRQIYGRILSDMNHQYLISYYPTNRERDGKLRKVRVEVRNHPEYIVRGRESYYALP